MNTEKILSGYELVSKGATKIEVTLPEVGLKDVFPTSSWLEQKQIQAALEARKHLIEVERIEKSGSLSHAIWREDLMLAEVTQKVGSCWQYLGHNKGKQLFLEPEEALFLMEINSLHLKHNDVKVSLQQAYSLLLRGKITLLKYKVYASLSRLGYRIYRHEKAEQNWNKNDTIHNVIVNDKISNGNNQKDDKKELVEQAVFVKNDESDVCILVPVKENVKIGGVESEDNQTEVECSTINFSIPSHQTKTRDSYGLKKLQKLNSRTLLPCNEGNIHKFFESLPELTDKNIVLIEAPKKQHIPNSINLTKSTYNINLENIQNKNVRSVSVDTNIYTINDEVNGSHVRRIRNTSMSTWTPPFVGFGFTNQHIQCRQQFNYWRPRTHYNYINFSLLFQRHYSPGFFFTPRFQFPRPSTHLFQTNYNNIYKNFQANNGKRRARAKNQHLDEIKKLAFRTKQLILSGNTEEHSILVKSLHTLIKTYNTKYKTRLRLSDDFNVIVDETIVDTIDLDDDEPTIKRRRSDSHDGKLDENLNLLKKLASQLHELEKKNKSSARHRRAFSKLLKTFNESYNEEYYLSESYDIENRQQITLDSDSSSSTESTKEVPKLKKGKKLRNPFNILKRLAERQSESSPEASTSRIDDCSDKDNKKYSEFLLKTFTKTWLPPENDFGRAEIVSQESVYNELIDIKKEEFLFDFLKIQTCQSDNWLQVKKSFFTTIKEAIAEFQGGAHEAMSRGINSLVKSEDCTDMETVLKKLRIIRTENGVKEECNLAIDFDVYNRDVQNFRKTKRPTPHFRIICLDESKHVPSGSEIASLHSKYDDKVIIVFAIVGIESISYMQINPIDLPEYISNNT